MKGIFFFLLTLITAAFAACAPDRISEARVHQPELMSRGPVQCIIKTTKPDTVLAYTNCQTVWHQGADYKDLGPREDYATVNCETEVPLYLYDGAVLVTLKGAQGPSWYDIKVYSPRPISNYETIKIGEGNFPKGWAVPSTAYQPAAIGNNGHSYYMFANVPPSLLEAPASFNISGQQIP